MKNIEIIFTVSALFATGFTEITAQSVSGIWSGSVSFHQVYTGQTGYGETHITVNITDNIATGTVKGESEAKIAGVLLSKGTCSGAGNAELHQLIVNKEARTYLIEVIAPSCIGESYDYASKKTIPSNPKDRRSVSVSNKNLINLNVLAGTETKTQDVSGMGTVTTTITWNLTRSVDGELIVTPEDYDNWLPAPGKNDVLKGSVMNISLKLLGRNGQAPKVKAKSFEVSLSNTSQEPGITLNAPITLSSNQLPDLRLLKHPVAESKALDQFTTIPCSDGSTGKVYIGSYDGGGWTTLTVEAILEDDTRVKGNLLVAGGIQDIPIPKRKPGSKIATAWLIANGDPDEMDDKESTGGNKNNGDGLTAYEEYRGVISEAQFRRLDPNEKELGVLVKRGELPLFSEGFGWFETATGMKVIRFYENEIGGDRRMNKNFASSHNYDQYVLKLEKKHVRKNVLGRTEPAPGTPKSVKRVMIDYDQIVAMQQKTEREAKRQNVQLPYTLEEILAKTVAHEVGHGVNIPHHGNDELTYVKRTINKTDPVRIFFPYGIKEETTRPYLLEGLAGKTGNQGSGDIFCIMNYNPSYDWAFKENTNSFIFYMVPLLPAGNIMCNSKAGTDINATPDYFGDATGGGNCLSHINLKD